MFLWPIKCSSWPTALQLFRAPLWTLTISSLSSVGHSFTVSSGFEINFNKKSFRKSTKCHLTCSHAAGIRFFGDGLNAEQKCDQQSFQKLRWWMWVRRVRDVIFLTLDNISDSFKVFPRWFTFCLAMHLPLESRKILFSGTGISLWRTCLHRSSFCQFNSPQND